MSAGDDPLFHAVVDERSGDAVGVLAYLRIDPQNGAIEVGHINFSPRLQRTPAATEALYLMARRAFDELGYRRYEWKCDSLNAPSRRAATRLGFQFEGLFRQAGVYKGRNRDTAWFSILDAEWPALRTAYEQWLASENFDADGRQRRSLGDLIAEHQQPCRPQQRRDEIGDLERPVRHFENAGNERYRGAQRPGVRRFPRP